MRTRRVLKRKWLLALSVMMAMLVCGLTSVALAYDPINFTSACTPNKLSGPQKVKVTISISNVADSPSYAAVPIALYDPAGNQVTFNNGATQVAYQQKAVYSGDWNVTQAELDAGKIVYKLSYNVIDDNTGNPVGASKGISIGIGKTKPTPKVTADYTISPSNAGKGQKVTLTYTISNVGNTDVIEAQVTNAALGKDAKIVFGRINAGQQMTKTYDYTMGTKNITVKPKVTYKPDGTKDVLTLTLKEKTIKYRKGDVVVNLKAKGDAEVKPGTTVELECTITNNSNVNFTNLRIYDPLIGDIATNISLKAGKKVTQTKSVVVDQTGDYAFHVESVAKNEELEQVSNVVRLIAIDMSKQLDLLVTTEAQIMEIREQPAEILFTVKVKNQGETPGKEIVVKHGKTTIATIASLAPGEEQVLAKTLRVSMEGKFMFTVSGVNEQGATNSFDSNVLQIAYLAPTPEPTIAPAATPQPPTDVTPAPPPTTTAPEGGAGSGGFGTTILWILAGLLMLAMLAVLAIVLLGRREQQKSRVNEAAIDSMERGARRDYASQHRGATAQADDYDDTGYESGTYDAPATKRGVAQPKQDSDMLSSNASMHELAAMYGRPDAAETEGRSRKSARGREAAPDTDIDAYEGDTTSAYLARMRGDPAKPSRRGSDASAQESQYRLTRKPSPATQANPLAGETGSVTSTRKRRTRSADV